MPSKAGPTGRAFLVVMGLLALAAAGQVPDQRWEASLAECELQGAVLTGRGVEPLPTYVTSGDAPLRMEAESASRVSGPVEEIEDTACSGGRRLEVPNDTYRGTGAAAVFAVQLPVAGTKRLWLRTFWPDIGANSFYLGLDGGKEDVFGNTEGPTVIGVWHWLPGPTWDLNAGAHTVTVRWREDGTQLDLALLADADYVPSSEADLNRSVQAGPPARLAITTPDIHPERVSAWRRVGLQPVDLEAVANTSVSLDGGATWRAVSTGSLNSLPVRRDGSDRLRLRVALDNPEAHPFLAGLAITYRGGPWKITLANERVAFDVSRADGRLMCIHNRDTDTRLAWNATPLFRLDYLAHGDTEVRPIPDDAVRFSGYELTHDGTGVDLHYDCEAPGGRLRVRCHGELPPDGSPSWWIEVTNEAQNIDVVEVHFPRVSGVRIGSEGADDWLIWPRWGCRRIPHPARNAPGRVLYPGGTAQMNWLDLYEEANGGQGLYLASEDEAILMGELVVQPDGGTGTISIGMSKMPRVAPGASFRSANFVIAPHRGDWHWAADRYREWLRSWMKPYAPPEWLVDCDGWLGTGRGTNVLNDLPTRYRLARKLGLNYIENWGQMMWGVAVGESCCNRLYFPDPRYGTEADFTEAVAYVRKAGGHIGFYTNGQAWNPRYPKLRDCYKGLLPDDIVVPDWEREAHNWGLIRAAGSYVPQYAKPEGDSSPYPCGFYLMCSHARGWQDYLHHYIVDRYVKRYGVDAMYVDQVGAATAQACFAKSHGHDDCVGAWGRGHLENFRRLQTDGRRVEPDFVLATEGLVDVYGQYVDIFLLSPVASRRWPYVAPEVLRYTLPEFICYDGFANGLAGATRSPGQVINEVFLLGNRFDFFRKSPEIKEHFKQVLRLRQETGPLLYRGRFLDETGLVRSDERLRAKLWRLDNDQARGWLVNVYNEQRVEGGTVTVRVGDAGSVQGWRATLGEPLLRPVSVEIRDRAARFDVPVAMLSTTLLLTEARPWMLRAFAPVATPGAEDAVEVRYRPLAQGLAVEGRAALRGPAGWTTQEVTFRTDTPQNVRVPFTVPTETGLGVYPVTVAVRVGADTWTRRDTVLLEEPLDIDIEVQVGRFLANLTNRGTVPLDVAYSATGPDWLHLPEPTGTVTVPPDATDHHAIAWRAPGGIPEKADVAVTARLGGREYRATARLEPLDLSIAQWRPQRYEGEVECQREEEAGVLTIRTADTKDRGGWQWRTAMVGPGRRYRFVVQCRTAGLVSAEEGAKVRIIFPHRDNLVRGAAPTVYTEALTGDNDWVDLEAEFAVPETAQFVQTELFHWHAAGRSEWRGARLRPLD